jgi:hypothetical protein
VKLSFAPWDAFYVVFGNPAARVKAPEATDPGRPAALVVKGPWKLTPTRKTVEAPYGMRFHRAWDGLGVTHGFAKKVFNDERWDETWLSREKWTVRDWWIVGPFDNKDHAGCYGAFPPESRPDEKAAYGERRWNRYVSPAMAVDLYSALGMPIGADGTAYAMTYVYSAAARRVQLRVAANNNAHLVLRDAGGVRADAGGGVQGRVEPGDGESVAVPAGEFRVYGADYGRGRE